MICLKMPRSRPTKDIDFLAKEIKNVPAELEYIFKIIANIPCDDLKKAIESTFHKRKTSIPDDLVVFRSEFHSDKEKQKQWSAFLRKSRLHDVNQGFNEIMERITSFLKPIVDSIKDKTREGKTWDAIAGGWKK